MTAIETAEVEVHAELLDAIASFPVVRTVHHCGNTFGVSPFAVYAVCPDCRARLKVRSFAGVPELEDVFDAVFAWMNRPGAARAADERRREMAEDD